jgi:succinate dehydrogenase / fumarate reductase flavoprotein subunit
VRNLFAAGECACVSVHGGNRLGANSLLDTVVFGRRAGETAAELAKETPFASLNEDALVRAEEEKIRGMMARESNGDSVARVRLEMGQAMDRYVGVYREEEGLQAARETLRQLRWRYARVPVADKGRVFNTSLVFALELGYMLDCAEAVVASAQERKDSRGAHFWRDRRGRDDTNWLKHILATRTTEGPRISHLPVAITRWPPEKRVY